MIREPKAWRVAAGFSVASVARQAGIQGNNPVRTYSRYESGENPCPAEVVEAVRMLSDGEVGAESWQKVRLDFLRRGQPSPPSEGAAA